MRGVAPKASIPRGLLRFALLLVAACLIGALVGILTEPFAKSTAESSTAHADEPTAALDRATSTTTMEVLTRACRHAGAALLVVTHDLDVAASCDRTVRMRDGRVHGVVTNPSAASASSTATAGSVG